MTITSIVQWDGKTFVWIGIGMKVWEWSGDGKNPLERGGDGKIGGDGAGWKQFTFPCHGLVTSHHSNSLGQLYKYYHIYGGDLQMAVLLSLNKTPVSHTYLRWFYDSMNGADEY